MRRRTPTSHELKAFSRHWASQLCTDGRRNGCSITSVSIRAKRRRKTRPTLSNLVSHRSGYVARVLEPCDRSCCPVREAVDTGEGDDRRLCTVVVQETRSWCVRVRLRRSGGSGSAPGDCHGLRSTSTRDSDRAGLVVVVVVAGINTAVGDGGEGEGKQQQGGGSHIERRGG